jgi:hypothetical protein
MKRTLGRAEILVSLFLVIALPTPLFAYILDFQTDNVVARVGAHVSHDYVLDNGSSSNSSDVETVSDYTWGSQPVQNATAPMTSDAPNFSASASSHLETSGSNPISMGAATFTQADVTGIEQGQHFAVDARSLVELQGYFRIESGPGETDQIYTTFNFSLNGTQKADGDFASEARAFWGVYDDSWNGTWNGHDDPLLIGYYEYASDPSINDEIDTKDSPSLILRLAAGEGYKFDMWLEVESYGSEHGDDGFVQDGMVVGEATTNFDSTFELTGVETAAVPIPGTVILFGSGLIGLAGFRKRFKK